MWRTLYKAWHTSSLCSGYRVCSHITHPFPLSLVVAYASSIKLSSKDAALSLAMLNGASLIGRLGAGFLSDIVSPWAIASTTLVLTALSIFILWGVLSFTFAGVLAYGIVYGCLASGWTSLWARFLRPIASTLQLLQLL